MILEGVAAVVSAGAAVYATLIEAYRLDVTELEFSLDRLPPEFDGFTILHMSDLHFKKETFIQKPVNTRLEGKLLDLVAGRRFDMIAITGDLELRGEGFDAMRRVLDSVTSEHGVFFTPGNGEYQHYDIDQLLEALDSWGVKTLRNESFLIEKAGAGLRIIGVDDPFTRHSDLRAALREASPNEFKLLLAHSPAIAGEAIGAQIDLVLSGHTHGGQVRLPILGAPYTHLGRGSPKLDQGVFEGRRLSQKTGVDAGRTKVYVTRGVGMSNTFVRFLCPPEIAIITLRRLAAPTTAATA